MMTHVSSHPVSHEAAHREVLVRPQQEGGAGPDFRVVYEAAKKQVRKKNNRYLRLQGEVGLHISKKGFFGSLVDRVRNADLISEQRKAAFNFVKDSLTKTYGPLVAEQALEHVLGSPPQDQEEIRASDIVKMKQKADELKIQKQYREEISEAGQKWPTRAPGWVTNAQIDTKQYISVKQMSLFREQVSSFREQEKYWEEIENLDRSFGQAQVDRWLGHAGIQEGNIITPEQMKLVREQVEYRREIQTLRTPWKALVSQWLRHAGIQEGDIITPQQMKEFREQVEYRKEIADLTRFPEDINWDMKGEEYRKKWGDYFQKVVQQLGIDTKPILLKEEIQNFRDQVEFFTLFKRLKFRFQETRVEQWCEASGIQSDQTFFTIEQMKFVREQAAYWDEIYQFDKVFGQDQVDQWLKDARVQNDIINAQQMENIQRYVEAATTIKNSSYKQRFLQLQTIYGKERVKETLLALNLLERQEDFSRIQFELPIDKRGDFVTTFYEIDSYATEGEVTEESLETPIYCSPAQLEMLEDILGFMQRNNDELNPLYQSHTPEAVIQSLAALRQEKDSLRELSYNELLLFLHSQIRGTYEESLEKLEKFYGAFLINQILEENKTQKHTLLAEVSLEEVQTEAEKRIRAAIKEDKEDQKGEGLSSSPSILHKLFKSEDTDIELSDETWEEIKAGGQGIVFERLETIFDQEIIEVALERLYPDAEGEEKEPYLLKKDKCNTAEAYDALLEKILELYFSQKVPGRLKALENVYGETLISTLMLTRQWTREGLTQEQFESIEAAADRALPEAKELYQLHLKVQSRLPVGADFKIISSENGPVVVFEQSINLNLNQQTTEKVAGNIRERVLNKIYTYEKNIQNGTPIWQVQRAAIILEDEPEARILERNSAQVYEEIKVDHSIPTLYIPEYYDKDIHRGDYYLDFSTADSGPLKLTSENIGEIENFVAREGEPIQTRQKKVLHLAALLNQEGHLSIPRFAYDEIVETRKNLRYFLSLSNPNIKDFSITVRKEIKENQISYFLTFKRNEEITGVQLENKEMLHNAGSSLEGWGRHSEFTLKISEQDLEEGHFENMQQVGACTLEVRGEVPLDRLVPMAV